VILLGVDGGGTRTRAVAVDGDGKLRATAQGSCGNYQIIGLEGLQELMTDLVARLGIRADQVCLGLAGAGRAVERETVAAGLLKQFGVRGVTVVSDAQAALTGAHGGGPGLIAISGTGSIILGRDAGGKEARAGGWGSILGDDGSGYSIGLAALRAVLGYRDGTRPATALAGQLLPGIGVNDWDQLIPLVCGGKLSPEQISGLCPIVFSAARNGDSAACRIVDEAATALGDQVAAVSWRLGMQERAVLACVGGVFRDIGMLWPQLAKTAGARGAVLRRQEPLLPPVLGAVLLAAAGVPELEPSSMLPHLLGLRDDIEAP
jgi:N-acetylglucosamine kinase-like BadF-type ATPase